MEINGVVEEGIARGKPLIDYYFSRLKNVLGFEPFRGTLNIKVDEPVNIKEFSTKRLEHYVESSGMVPDVYLAEVEISKGKKKHKCWAISVEKGVRRRDIIEIIDKDMLKSKMKIKDGNKIKIKFLHNEEKKDIFSLKNVVDSFFEDNKLKK